jgi:hypothetical protein
MPAIACTLLCAPPKCSRQFLLSIRKMGIPASFNHSNHKNHLKDSALIGRRHRSGVFAAFIDAPD